MISRYLAPPVALVATVACVKSASIGDDAETPVTDSGVLDTGFEARPDTGDDDSSQVDSAPWPHTGEDSADTAEVEYTYKGDLNGVWDLEFVASQYPYECQCRSIDVVLDESATPHLQGLCVCTWPGGRGASEFELMGELDAADGGTRMAACVRLTGTPIRGGPVDTSFTIYVERIRGSLSGTTDDPCNGSSKPHDFWASLAGWWDRPLGT